MINVRYKLRLCILSNFLLLVLITLPILLMNNNQSKYFRTGWHDDLILISVPINSFARYFITCLFLIAIEISDVIIGEIAHPIIGFNIYNPDKKIITDFTKNELQLYGNTMYIIEALKRILMIVISITQIDFALYRVLFGNIASIFTIRMILNEKSYTLSNDNTKYKKEKLEENETEMV